jgi:putative membrane protein
VLAGILIGDVKRNSDGWQVVATPVVGAFIMVLWDLAMDPMASTLAQWWIWHKGGGYFGVPLQNFLGWYLTVFAFMLIFALYLSRYGPEESVPQPKSYYRQAIAMYAVVALDFVASYILKGSEHVTDATGMTWRSGDIYETSALVALLTMMFVVVITTLKVAREPDETRRQI